MEVEERMRSLRTQFPECTLMAFADLSAWMILSVIADTSRMQEEISGLCSTANDVLSCTASGSLCSLITNGTDTNAFEAILIEHEEVGVFLRSTVKQNDAFCCVCSAQISLSHFLPAVRAAIDTLDVSQ